MDRAKSPRSRDNSVAVAWRCNRTCGRSPDARSLRVEWKTQGEAGECGDVECLHAECAQVFRGCMWVGLEQKLHCKSSDENRIDVGSIGVGKTHRAISSGVMSAGVRIRRNAEVNSPRLKRASTEFPRRWSDDFRDANAMGCEGVSCTTRSRARPMFPLRTNGGL